MIGYLTILLVLTIGVIAGYLVSYKVNSRRIKQKTKKILSSGTGRFGIIEAEANYRKFTIEIEEIGEAGTLTKVRVVAVVASSGESYSHKDLLSKSYFKEWLPTKEIIWYNNNSQKIRDSKISQILSENIQ